MMMVMVVLVIQASISQSVGKRNWDERKVWERKFKEEEDRNCKMIVIMMKSEREREGETK